MQPAKLQRLLQEATVHIQAGRLEAAARLCAQARLVAPRDFNALALSGILAVQQERFPEAADWLSRAARLQPRSSAVAVRLGFSLAKLARFDEADLALSAAVALVPGDAEAWDTLGFVRQARGQLREAIGAHQRAISLDPSRANSWYNLGQALLHAGRPAEALPCQERALAADPTFGKAHYGRALALQHSYRIAEAVAAYGEALAAEPKNIEARSYRLLALNYLDGWSREMLFAEHVAFGLAVPAAGNFPGLTQIPDPSRRLRVAFLSPDLREHSVASFIEPLLAHLDPAQFEIVLYHDHFVVDATTARLCGYAALWRNFIGQPAAAVETVIRADAPDVLIDLAGHTGLNRLVSFARRLAPVQISYLGYPNTTGLQTMDYRLVDPITDPLPEADQFCTERLVRFAGTAWAYQPPAVAPVPVTRPCASGSPITFGCFNNFAKVSDTALEAWGRLMAELPGSRLRLKATGFGGTPIAEQVRARLRQAGLDQDRVDLVERTTGCREHLELYQGVDIALDTAPYNGTTTTCEALWMGVPVITLAGDRHAARVGASLLSAVGHSEWIAAEWDDYIRIAAKLGRAPTVLAASSQALRQDVARSALMDHAGQAARFGTAIRDCWSGWCARSSLAA